MNEANDDFSIVGIGASAGGLAAFEKFFSAIPPEPNLAFVVVQHLSPPHKSILPEILQRYTVMPVSQVTEGVEVKPNEVYVIPPGSDLAMRGGFLTLVKPEQARGYRLPIDFFFRSLAQDQTTLAIGVVLSGTGSDGSLGLRTIKADGGLTIAQEPETAEYADMPRNAIATQEVDFILPPEKMGELIVKYAQHRVISGYKRGTSEPDIPVGGLQKLYYLLRAKTGNDFSLYKQTTLMRRIERRMKICLLKGMDEYIEYLNTRPEEIEALFQEMLINVTHFFRDPEAWKALIEKAIRPMIARKKAARAPLRVWVAGCSTGEEAYSLAIILQEQMEALEADCDAHIFATDLDAAAIASARKGYYPEGSLENVSAERLERFFLPKDDGYLVRDKIREMVVFSPQNVIYDPPYSKIDLVCCRNLMIYLEHELQNQLCRQFHFSLNPDGWLFLGNSESISASSHLFSVIDRKNKIFQRKDAADQRLTRMRTGRLLDRSIPNKAEAEADRSTSSGLRDWTEKVLLEFHSPACAVIDRKHNILFIHGRTGKYLEPSAGVASNNLMRMAREGLKTELAAAIHTTFNKRVTVRREGLRVKTNGNYQTINLTTRLIDGLADYGELVMVVFEEVEKASGDSEPEAAGEPASVERAPTSRQIAQLQKELKEKDDYLHTIIDELEDTNQDQKSSNEELQSINEELQSSNEELETSKEELQSINEELSTINAELQNKNEELSGVNNDIYNLLASIEIGMVFLDLDLRIRRFTPASQRIYNLVLADIGRPISHFVLNLKYHQMEDDIRMVLRTLKPVASEAVSKDGTWYLINIRPYRTLENVIDGVVITFVDVSKQKETDALRRLGTILEDANDAVTVQDFSGKILAWNRGATLIYGWSKAKALSKNYFDLVPEEKRAETLDLYQQLALGKKSQSFLSQRLDQKGHPMDMWITLTVLVDDADQPVAIASTERVTGGDDQYQAAPFFEKRALKAVVYWHERANDEGKTSAKLQAEAACQILVAAGYRSAWIGKVADDSAGSISVAAWRGVKGETSKRLVETSRDTVQTAHNRGQAIAVQNTLTGEQDGTTQPAVQSYLVIPVDFGKDWANVVVVFAGEPDAFASAENAHLAHFCGLVSKAINDINTKGEA